MSFGVFLAVLGAALLHAGWNAIVKTGLSKQTSMFLMSACQMLWGVPIVLLSPWPEPGIWIWIAASALIHTAYQLFLAYAYEQGDLSRVYPISRGTAPMLVLAVSLLWLDEPLEPMALLGVLVLGAGIALMARGVFSSGESRRLLPFAFGAAVATASYTVVDGLGAREWGEPVAYVGWLLLFTGILYTVSVATLRGRAVLRAGPRDWGMGMLAGLASFAAYAISIWAITLAPLALVAALRETSILFAVLIGWLLFGDRMDRVKATAAGLIVLGVVLTRL